MSPPKSPKTAAPAAAPVVNPPCSNDGKGGNGKGNNIAGRTGTNVFTAAKTNATNAVGMVGTFKYTIPSPPYVVERCDQILQIKGKKMSLTDYCIQTPAFMTLSIYMVNLFDGATPDKLSQSINFNEIRDVPMILQGTTKCMKFQGKSSAFGFCYDTHEIAEQIVTAYTKFYNCSKGSDNPLIDVLLESCDISKIDFTIKGPFGKDGPKILARIEQKRKKKDYGYGKVDKSLVYDPKALNKFYSLINAPGTNSQ